MNKINAFYRAELNAKCGKDVLSKRGSIPVGVTESDYALYLLLSAVEELAIGLKWLHEVDGYK